MNLFDRHRRFRSKLSAYIDGELSSDEVRSLDTHLKSCDSCRLDLDEMRAAVDALKGIPEVDAPRSFRLTPEMVAERRPAASWSPSPGLMNGMRMATAGLTVALALVFVVDLGGSGEDSRTAGSLSESAPLGLEADGDVAPLSADGDVNLDEAPPGDDGSSDGGAVGEDTRDSVGERELMDNLDDGTGEPAAPAGETTNDLDSTSDRDKTSGETQAELSAASGDGFDELLAAEIALGAALALAAAGTAGMTFARSRARRD